MLLLPPLKDLSTDFCPDLLGDDGDSFSEKDLKRMHMHFDALTVAAVAAELQQTIEEGRVQQVLAVDENSIGMEIYAQRQRHYLLLCADPKASRVYLAQEKLRRGVKKESPLLLLLRKYVRGGQLTAIMQPDPTERVLILHFFHPEHGATQLIVECITQRGNLILVKEDGTILDCLRRSWAGAGVERPLMPKQPYTPPPAQEKFAPLAHPRIGVPAISPTQLSLLLKAGGALWRLLVHQFAGVSPTLAREIAWRVTGQLEGATDEADAHAIIETMSALWRAIDTGEWQPGVWFVDGAVAGFAPYVVHGREQVAPMASISAAVERYYNAPPAVATQRPTTETTANTPDAAHDGYQVLRRTVTELLDQAERRVQRQLRALAEDEPAEGEAATLRLQAEWLLALQSQITVGQQTLEVDLGDRTLTIPLADDKSAVQQAEQMFNRAAKLERAAQIIPERRAKLEDDLAYLAQLHLDLAQAENQPEIAAIQEELRAMGLLSTAPTAPSNRGGGAKVGGSQPHRYYSAEGFQIVVGRNARQNEQVTFDIAKAEDLWLHARGAPGSHVVIRCGGQAVSDDTLRMAAQLAAYHSKLAGEHAATVIVTPRRFVSRAPGGHPGQVLVRQEETLTVPAVLPTELHG